MSRCYLFVLAVMVVIAGCARSPTRWDAADVRLIDPPDDAPSPDTDIIALYTRPAGRAEQVRVDFLDLDNAPPQQVYLALDIAPGGSHELPGGNYSTELAWDLLIEIPGSLRVRLHRPDGTLAQQVPPDAQSDLAQDSLTVTLPPGVIPAEFDFQAFALTADGLADSTRPVASDGPPPARGSLLLCFRDVFPATTPATALRRWDGAHTGPYGERHGLHPLLDAAQRYEVPLVLLDLRAPRTLGALDLVGGLEQVRRMQSQGVLTVPDAGYNSLGDEAVVWSREAGAGFGLAPTDFLYNLSDAPQARYPYQFVAMDHPDHLARDDATGLILLPLGAPGEQVGTDGPLLETRRMLLSVALTENRGDLVSLGGSLPSSAWGDSDVGLAAMAYISDHPWIEPLDANGLLAFPAASFPYARPSVLLPEYARSTSQGNDAGIDYRALAGILRDSLLEGPAGVLTDAGWDMYFGLTDSTKGPELELLQAQYLGEVGVFLAASGWAAAPTGQATCDADIDFDNANECVLANEHVFAVFETDGGRLAWLFAVINGRPHQLVGGTEQFVAGLSDSSLWDLGRGPAGDPGQIPGAFVDADAPWAPYEVRSLGPDSLTLGNRSGTRTKSFRLMTDGVSAEYDLASPTQTRIALTLDPWRRFAPGWARTYDARLGEDQVRWSQLGGPSLTIQAPGRTGFAAFTDTLESLYGPEDPNQQWPAGHYLPFPMAVADYTLNDGALVTLRAR